MSNEPGDARGTARLSVGGLVSATGPDESVFAGMGTTVTFHAPVS